jgi:hypothetical protein
MKKLVLLILVTISFQIADVNGQASHHFALRDLSIDPYNRQIHLSTITSDGGMVVLTGNEYRSSISAADYGFSLIRFDANGNKLWNSFIYGEPNFNSAYKRLIELPDHGFAIAGNANGFGLGFVLKTDSSGNFVFMKNYSYEIFDCVLDPSDNGFLITINAGNSFSGIIKTNAAGDMLWSDSKNYTSDPDHYYIAKHLNNGNYLAVGVVYNDPGLVTGSALVTCYNAAGAIIWTQGYAGPEFVSSFNDFTELSDGSIVLAGISSTTNVNGSRTLLTKIDSAGTIQWCKSSVTGSNINNFGFTFSDNFLYAAGNYEISGSIVRPVIIKMDATGQVLWTRVFPDPDWANDVTFGSAHDFAIQNNHLGFNNYRTFCTADTALTQSCALYDTTFSMVNVTMTTVVTTATPATVIPVPTSLIRSNSTNVNFTKVDACTIAGIASQSDDALQVSMYPNPAKENVTVHLSNAEYLKGINIILINSLGQTIKQYLLNTVNTVVDLNDVNPGLYFYILQNQEKIVKTGKIIIE